MSRRIAVIMAGGVGERFWPLSKPERPKQLLKLTSETESMLEEAVNRIQGLFGKDNVYLATSVPLGQSATDLGIVERERIFGEPARRNTMGCLSWVAANLLANGLDNVTLSILTADHMIGQPTRFVKTVSACMTAAEATESIVTIGIVPDRPETGFGYIELDRGRSTLEFEGHTTLPVRRFREKPTQETAREFLDSGNFLWNSGMFFFTLSVFLREMQKEQPEAYICTLGMAEALRSENFDAATSLFEGLTSISIDFALMERVENIYVVPADFSWDDLGSWDALERTLPTDSKGNVNHGAAIIIDSEGSVIYNASALTVGVLGVRDLVVVVTDEAILVCPKGDAQRVREIARACLDTTQTL